jgi:hypothetical protein
MPFVYKRRVLLHRAISPGPQRSRTAGSRLLMRFQRQLTSMKNLCGFITFATQYVLVCSAAGMVDSLENEMLYVNNSLEHNRTL